MSRHKLSLPGLTIAHQRHTNITAFNPNFEMGDGTSMTTLDQAIKDAQARVDEYNRGLSHLDGLRNQVLADDKRLRDLAVRMLAAVAVRYGRDSNEYEMAGGTRQSERKNHNGNGAASPEPAPVDQPMTTNAR